MSQLTPPIANTLFAEEKELHPVIVIGTGPAGLRAVQELDRQYSGYPIKLFGNEPWTPYNRVKLSSLLAGDITEEEIDTSTSIPSASHITTHYNTPVIAIDPTSKTIQTQTGEYFHYHKLILATGSRAYVPNIPGNALPGVFTFRDLNDTQRLLARTTKSRHTLVIGGGLLGLETAKAMSRFNTHVTVIEHNRHIMFNQLDENAADVLSSSIEQENITLLSGEGVQQLVGTSFVESAVLRSGKTITCDTVVFATGIAPNIELAQAAGLAVGRGIKVNHSLQTSDESIYAIGECAEHEGKVYGLVAPGLEQASIAASHLAGNVAFYHGSTSATRLKVVGCPVFSMGDVQEREFGPAHASYTDETQSIYRKLIFQTGRLVGVIAIGPWEDIPRLQEAISKQRRLLPWQIWHFRRYGSIWRDNTADDVSTWPKSATICNCAGVTLGSIQNAIANGCQTPAQITAATGAGSVCGSCKPHLAELTSARQDAVTHWRTLGGLSVIISVFSLLFLLPLSIPYNTTVQEPVRWDLLWREGWLKQTSGFTLLGLGVLLSVLALRKRIASFRWGAFDAWRLIHVLIGTLAVTALVAHTGLRLGSGLNLVLVLCFIGMLLSGAVLGGVIGFEHKLNTSTGKRWRNLSLGTHLFLLWPIPALLIFHILKGYYF